MKKFVLLILALALVSAFALTSAYADETGKYILPGAIVDLTTQEGYDDFCAKAAEFDLISLTTGEYTVHGTNGLVEWEFIQEEDGTSFARFKPIKPLDENGKDENGERPANEGDFRMTAEIEFKIADYDYISFCYRTSPKAHLSQNQIYVRDDTHDGEFQATVGMWTAPGMKNKGEWTVKTIQISKSFSAAEGTFKSIRIPIAGRVNEYVDIKYIVVFNSKDLCANFDINAYHEAVKALAPEPTEEPPTEVPEEPTQAPETEAPKDTQAPTAEPEDKGCGGSFAGLLPLAVLVPAVLLRKKRH